MDSVKVKTRDTIKLALAAAIVFASGAAIAEDDFLLDAGWLAEEMDYILVVDEEDTPVFVVPEEDEPVARSKRDKKEKSCRPGVDAEFDDGKGEVTVTSSKDLSNVVLLYSDGTVKKFDGLDGRAMTFSTGDSQTVITGVWIKSGCNHSGDGPGYGEFVANDDASTYVPVVSINDSPVVVEQFGESVEVEFTISLSEPVPAGADVSIDVTTADGSAYAVDDFQPLFETVTLTAGELTATVNVIVVGDSIFEFPETFYVDLANPVNSTIGKSRGIATIYDYRDEY